MFGSRKSPHRSHFIDHGNRVSGREMSRAAATQSLIADMCVSRSTEVHAVTETADRTEPVHVPLLDTVLLEVA